ncbi:MAG: energy-coupling factor transporter transmembrane protein EcfT [Methanoregula sp.]|jgi:energy-coupling factor transport system permease protein|uniref:energy-coupling factor transporter transmembrane component T family protein n=1 Tax=Methanoregula sp. TaxID=2052170 RepID=UPI0025FAC5D2|nr:energy-coupling factor transporter transmembrane component T [Methanoregula sp.]MCK9630653.1 energy-coupling factor transporter transmembrane protein EcfT [Methanoregula sp.]
MNPDRQPTAGTGTTKKARRLMLFRYHPGTSFLHRLDPRTKLLTLLTVSASALLFSSLPMLVMIVLFELALACMSRITTRFLRALTLVSPIFVLVIVLDSLFSKVSSGPVWFSAQIGFLHPEVTTGGLLFAVAMGLRLLALFGISIIFIMTTSPDDFVRSLRQMGLPPILTFSLGYALKSTTALTGDTRQIMDAQRSRGLELDRGSLIKNPGKLAALFIPVTVSLLKRSGHTADAMQARGFNQSIAPSCYRQQKFGRRDVVMGIVLLALVLILVLIPLIPGGY